jgi:hypothetical protein
MPITPIQAAAEGVPAFTVEDLEEPIRHVQRMASILTTLLEECIVDTGKRETLSVDRREAEDLIFAAHKVEELAKAVADRWEAI